MKTDLIRFGAKLALQAQKHAPTLLTIGGAVSVGAGAIGVGIATSRLPDVKDKHEKELRNIHETQVLLEDHPGEYTEEMALQDKRRADLRFVGGVAKLYAVPVGLLGMGIAMLCGAQGIMKKRNAAIMALYNVTQEAYDKYRRRVREKYGVEVDKDMLYGRKQETIVIDERDPETGKVKKVKKEVTTVERDAISQYARWFDKSLATWDSNPDYRMEFLLTSQAMFNDRLQNRGYVFLNEVYEHLGIPTCPEGQIVGWVLRDVPSEADGYIDFGVYADRDDARLFVNGDEGHILLDFNVDGPIFQLLEDLGPLAAGLPYSAGKDDLPVT